MPQNEFAVWLAQTLAAQKAQQNASVSQTETLNYIKALYDTAHGSDSISITNSTGVALVGSDRVGYCQTS